MTVFDNMAFSLMLAKIDKATVRQRVDKASEILGLGELLQRYPRQLSGGQRQRVAMGRAIVRNRSEEHTSELQSLMRISYAVFCLKKKKNKKNKKNTDY